MYGLHPLNGWMDHLYQLILKNSVEQPATGSEEAHMSEKNRYKNITACMCIN